MPRKNLRPLAGVPLVVHSIRHALDSRHVRGVYVSTDDDEIAAVSKAAGASIVLRPPKLSADEATSESTLLHVLDELRAAGSTDPDLVVFLQCTSPIRRRGDIDGAIELGFRQKADTVLSACATKRFVWGLKNGEAVSLNYDYRHRKREQDFDEQYQENGSIYVTPPRLLRETGNRLSGRIAVYEMDYWSSFQIDSLEDFEICEWICARPEYRRDPAWPAHVGLVVFDFDGVMTDNRVLVSGDGSEAVFCSRGDGLGIERMRIAGIPMLILSKERNPVVAARAAKLQIPCIQSEDNKAGTLRRLANERGINLADVIYVGNDVNDLECLRMVGLPVTVDGAPASVMAAARLVLTSRGGQGAVRELCDLILARSINASFQQPSQHHD